MPSLINKWGSAPRYFNVRLGFPFFLLMITAHWNAGLLQRKRKAHHNCCHCILLGFWKKVVLGSRYNKRTAGLRPCWRSRVDDVNPKVFYCYLQNQNVQTAHTTKLNVLLELPHDIAIQPHIMEANRIALSFFRWIQHPQDKKKKCSSKKTFGSTLWLHRLPSCTEP